MGSDPRRYVDVNKLRSPRQTCYRVGELIGRLKRYGVLGKWNQNDEESGVKHAMRIHELVLLFPFLAGTLSERKSRVSLKDIFRRNSKSLFIKLLEKLELIDIFPTDTRTKNHRNTDPHALDVVENTLFEKPSSINKDAEDNSLAGNDDNDEDQKGDGGTKKGECMEPISYF